MNRFIKDGCLQYVTANYFTVSEDRTVTFWRDTGEHDKVECIAFYNSMSYTSITLEESES